jgi:glycosyltransferase involved in cell wall biosynthesis
MRIAQVAPLAESVPPKRYGGTERVVSYLTEELVRLGHDVTLFASGDSTTAARLIAPCPRALRLDATIVDRLAPHILMLEMVARRAHEFDIIHFHSDYLQFPLTRRLDVAHVTTLHGRLDLPELAPLYREFSDTPVVSISDAQRTPLPWARWVGTIHHGLPTSLYRFSDQPGAYLAFLGRISPEKRVDRAIAIARQAGLPLKIAAKVDDADRQYFEREIRHLLDDPLVEFLGEIDDAAKQSLLGNALALLFPIDWPEPFGIVMAEALACGTPVIAFRHGSVPEVIEDGVTGFIVESIDEAVAAVRRIPELSRRRCRDVFEARFSARRMATDYVRLYTRLIATRTQQPSDSLRVDKPVPLPRRHAAATTHRPARA